MQGSRIQGFVCKALIYIWGQNLEEGSIYSICGFTPHDLRRTSHKYRNNFQYETKVLKIDARVLGANMFSLFRLVRFWVGRLILKFWLVSLSTLFRYQHCLYTIF